MGKEEEAMRLMRKAIDACGDKVLCRDNGAGRKRVVEMRTKLVSMQSSESQQHDQQQHDFAVIR